VATSLTEKKAIGVLKQVLLDTGRIDPHILEDSTKISWDGELHIYDSKEKCGNKAHLIGRIPVQVKGTEHPEIENGRLKHSASLIDLEIYKKDGGCIYFVVDLSPQKSLIYYDLLLPYDLEKILSEKNNKKTTTRFLEQFPSKEDAIFNLMRLFLSEREKQFSTAKFTSNPDEKTKELISEHLQKGIPAHSITFLRTPENLFASCFDIPTYVYLNIARGFKIPIQRVRINSVSMNNLRYAISINGTQYYDSVRLTKDKDKEVLTFGKSTTIELPDSELPTDCKVCFSEIGTLSERIHDHEFWLALCSNDQNRLICKSIDDGDIILTFDGNNNTNCSGNNIILYENRLNDLKSIQKALEFFGVSDDLDMDALSEKDEEYLHILMLASRGEELAITIENFVPGTVAVAVSNIANLHIAVFLQALENGKYKIQNFFDMPNSTCEFLCNDEFFEASPYLKMGKQDFLKCSNIDYDVIYNSIASKPFVPYYNAKATEFLLEAISAYDEKPSENLMLFVDKFSAWLLEKDATEPQQLNRLQVLKRQRKLIEEEQEHLRSISCGNKDTIFKIGACILLESFLEARTLWDSLSEQEIENVKALPCFPILNLWTHHKPDI